MKTHNFVKLGNLLPTRDFNYISDTISACVASLDIKKYGETFNISSNSEISIKDLVKCFERIVGNKIKIKKEKRDLEIKMLKFLDYLEVIKEIKKYSNWKPKYVGKKVFIVL